MHKLILFFGILFFTACGATIDNSAKHNKADTTFKVITYIFDLQKNDIRNSIAAIVVQDTFTSVWEKNKDGDSVKKMKWITDTIYKVPVWIPMIDSATKKPALDSAGKQRTMLNWVVLPKRLYCPPNTEKDVTQYFK